jgi:DNA-directed RNA polymerase III subunit RPC6
LVKTRNMSTPEPSRKRARPDPSSIPTNTPTRALTERDKVLEAIRSRGNRGIWLADIKRESSIPQNIILKQIKALTQANLIKEVKDIRHKARKVFMAAEFEPSEEITGRKKK